MAISNDIERLLTDFSEKLVNDTRASLKNKANEKASRYGSKQGVQSRLSTSIEAPITYEDGSIILRLQMNKYGGAVNDGRKPTTADGSGDVRQNLIRWIKTRGLKVEISKRRVEKHKALKDKTEKKSFKSMSYEKKVEQMAYAIANKIHKVGYEGNHFYDEVINDGRMEVLINDLKELIKTDFNFEITKP